jgi:SAM-dependent methyltransferase
MTKVSIFTPVPSTHLPYLEEAFESLKTQTCEIWEWVLIPNGGAEIPPEISEHEQVKVIPFTGKPDGETGRYRIGELKAFACAHCTGEVLVELDADDMLTPCALAVIVEAFADPLVQFVYSSSVGFEIVGENNVLVRTDKSAGYQMSDGTIETTLKPGDWHANTYGEHWGWRTRPFVWQGHELTQMIAWPPGPHMMRRVEWAPNHVRAWRATAYKALGGHNAQLEMGDDHELCCRTYIVYGAAGMRHIDECLYLYRVHGANACRVTNHIVQQQTQVNYLNLVQPMAARWAQDEGLRLVDLGGRLNAAAGYETVDLLDADIIADLEDVWPFDDNSIGVIRASHIFEHLRDPVHTMNEAYRVLAPGGWLFCEIPSTDGRGAFQDPTHVSFWNINSFWYYTQAEKAAFVPSIKCRFQVAFLQNIFPGQWWHANNIPIVRADLIALKPPYDERPVGEVLI